MLSTKHIVGGGTFQRVFTTATAIGRRTCTQGLHLMMENQRTTTSSVSSPSLGGGIAVITAVNSYRIARSLSAVSHYRCYSTGIVAKTAALGELKPAYLQRVVSWAAAAALEKTKREISSEKDYAEFITACETRMWQLHEDRMLTAEDLLRFVKANDEISEGMLSILVGCARRLMDHDPSSLNNLSEFLFLVSFKPARHRARCGRLKIIVDTLRQKVNKVPLKCLLRGLFGASRFSCLLQASSLMSEVEKMWGHRLAELSWDELRLFLLASSRISGENGYDGRRLSLKFLAEHSGQLPKWPLSLSVDLLTRLAFSFADDTDIRQSLRKAFSGVEQHLAQDLMDLKSSVVSSLSVFLNMISHTSKHILLKDYFVCNMESLSPEAFVQISHTVAKQNSVFDESLRDQMLAYLMNNVEQFNTTQIGLFLTTLTQYHISCTLTARQLGDFLAQKVLCQFMVMSPPYSPAECAMLFYRFVRLGMEEQHSNLLALLSAQALEGFQCLPLCELGRFVFGVSRLKNNHRLVVAVAKAMSSRRLGSEVSSVLSFSVLCKGLVRMRVVDIAWLAEIAELCRQNVSALPTSHSLRVAVVSLSLLDFQCPTLFADVRDCLDNQVVDELAKVKEMISVMWACMQQDFFPSKLANRLSELTPSCILELFYSVQQEVHQLDLLWWLKYTTHLLEHETCTTLLNALAKGQEPFRHPIEDQIVGLFPSRHVQRDITTAEGCSVPMMLLLGRDHRTVAWPAGVDCSPAVSDVHRLVAHGCQPIAIFVLTKHCFDFRLKKLLGRMKMKCWMLELCGWKVLPISILHYNFAEDKRGHLCCVLANAGIDVISTATCAVC